VALTAFRLRRKQHFYFARWAISIKQVHSRWHVLVIRRVPYRLETNARPLTLITRLRYMNASFWEAVIF
jgi:hypothetical protein